MGEAEMSDNTTAGAARQMGAKTEEAFEGFMGDVRSQVSGAAEQVAAKAQDAYGKTGDAVSSVADQARTMGQRAGSQASELGQRAYAQSTRATRYVGGQVREEPLIALVMAGALGVLIGYLVSRSPHQRAVELGRFRASYRDR